MPPGVRVCSVYAASARSLRPRPRLFSHTQKKAAEPKGKSENKTLTTCGILGLAHRMYPIGTCLNCVSGVAWVSCTVAHRELEMVRGAGGLYVFLLKTCKLRSIGTKQQEPPSRCWGEARPPPRRLGRRPGRRARHLFDHTGAPILPRGRPWARWPPARVRTLLSTRWSHM